MAIEHTLEEQARGMGFQGDWHKFQRMLLETQEELFPGIAADMVICDDDVDAFAGVVRYKAKCWNLSSNLIKRTLMRLRKAGKEKLAKEGLISEN